MPSQQLELDLGLCEPLSEQQGEELTYGDNTIPHPCTPDGLTVDRNRSKLLDALYRVNGRHERSHPQHGLYTGLYEDFALRTGRSLLDRLLEVEDFEKAVLGGMFDAA